MYKLYSGGVIWTDGTAIKGIPSDPANSDWQTYQEWLAADPANISNPAD